MLTQAGIGHKDRARSERGGTRRDIAPVGYAAPATFEESQCMAETLEDRIRERAYRLWEDGGRPAGRDEEFWHRACETVAGDGIQSRSTSERRQPKRAQSPQLPRKRGRRTSPPASSGLSAPVGSL
jgi:Protein of unknown function (DUF2934)